MSNPLLPIAEAAQHHIETEHPEWTATSYRVFDEHLLSATRIRYTVMVLFENAPVQCVGVEAAITELVVLPSTAEGE